MDAELRAEALYSSTVTHGVHRHPMDGRSCREYVVGECAFAAPAVTETDRARIERDARLQDALDALDLATLWLHRTSDLPHMPSHQAESWERKARSGRVALRAALAAPAVTETADRRAALDVGEVSIALQRSGALSKHLSYHDLARCFIAALTDGRTDLGAPDEHVRHKAAPAVTETDHALHYDPDCEECVYLARPVVIRPADR